MNEGKYIFTQITNLIPRQIFQRLVKKYNGDYRVREFNCTNQLKYMLFGQLMPCDSLRDICLCLGKHKKLLYGLGMTTSVNESSLTCCLLKSKLFTIALTLLPRLQLWSKCMDW